MTARERQQLAYELAFCPWRLDRFWRMYKSQGLEGIPQDELRALDDAALLHLPISESSYADVHALERLAGYQVMVSRYITCARFLRTSGKGWGGLPSPRKKCHSSCWVNTHCPMCQDHKNWKGAGMENPLPGYRPLAEVVEAV